MKLVSYETNCGQKQNEVFLTSEHKSVLARDIYKKKNFLNLFMQGQLRSVESKKKTFIYFNLSRFSDNINVIFVS